MAHRKISPTWRGEANITNNNNNTITASNVCSEFVAQS